MYSKEANYSVLFNANLDLVEGYNSFILEPKIFINKSFHMISWTSYGGFVDYENSTIVADFFLTRTNGSFYNFSPMMVNEQKSVFLLALRGEKRLKEYFYEANKVYAHAGRFPVSVVFNNLIPFKKFITTLNVVDGIFVMLIEFDLFIFD